MPQRFFLCLPMLILAACASCPQPSDDSPPGATIPRRTALGYELENPHMAVTIDAETGDVVDFRGAGQKSGPMKISAGVAGIPPAQPQGHVEARDDQTWAYIGVDPASHIGWRKIYCLDGHWLDVSFIVQNLSAHPIAAQIELIGNFATSRGAGEAPAEVHSGPCHFQAFDVSQAIQPPAAAGQPFLRSDLEPLKPGERMSWTMRWWITPQ